MNALPATILPRVAQLVRLFGSDRDGEVLGAVRAIGRTLQANGADFHVLADRIEHEPAPRVIYRDRPAADRRHGTEASAWSALSRTDRLKLLTEARESAALSPWERSFAASVFGQVQTYRQTSAKQAAVMGGIMAKLNAAEVRA